MTAKKKGTKSKKLSLKKESLRKHGQLGDREVDKAAGGQDASIGSAIPPSLFCPQFPPVSFSCQTACISAK
jgi:hypothetical protein